MPVKTGDDWIVGTPKGAERMQDARMNYFIRNATFEARRRTGFYELVTGSQTLWHELYLYGQMLAQAQDENIDGGEGTL
jgi:hypothetical protein